MKLKNTRQFVASKGRRRGTHTGLCPHHRQYSVCQQPCLYSSLCSSRVCTAHSAAAVSVQLTLQQPCLYSSLCSSRVCTAHSAAAVFIQLTLQQPCLYSSLCSSRVCTAHSAAAVSVQLTLQQPCLYSSLCRLIATLRSLQVLLV